MVTINERLYVNKRFIPNQVKLAVFYYLASQSKPVRLSDIAHNTIASYDSLKVMMGRWSSKEWGYIKREPSYFQDNYNPHDVPVYLYLLTGRGRDYLKKAAKWCDQFDSIIELQERCEAERNGFAYHDQDHNIWHVIVPPFNSEACYYLKDTEPNCGIKTSNTQGLLKLPRLMNREYSLDFIEYVSEKIC